TSQRRFAMTASRIVLFACLLLAAGLAFCCRDALAPLLTFDRAPFESICRAHPEKYDAALCANVGRHAYTTQAVLPVNDADLGIMTGGGGRKKEGGVSPRGDLKRYPKNTIYYYLVCGDVRPPESCQLGLGREVEAGKIA